jgi:cyclopropane fatty-acyl-phospholipid synthase-like methyltransferase
MKLYHQVDRVFNELDALGIGRDDPLDVTTISAFDQYHYMGTAAVDEAVSRIGITPTMRVLEIGGGIGGPARYLAHVSGCHMTVLELQQDLNDTAQHLTRRCGLENRVEHVCGNILEGVPNTEQFDALVSWLTFLHIPDRPALYERCFEALKPGARVYVEDYFERGMLTDAEKTLLSREVYCDHVPSMNDYQCELEQTGFRNIEIVDMSDSWTRFVESRLAGFRKSNERNIELHGTEIVDGLGQFYSTIVALFQAGNLGGISLTARRPD